MQKREQECASYRRAIPSPVAITVPSTRRPRHWHTHAVWGHTHHHPRQNGPAQVNSPSRSEALEPAHGESVDHAHLTGRGRRGLAMRLLSARAPP